MPKLTDISSGIAGDPENSIFLNKTGPNRKISLLNIYGKLQWMKSISFFDVLNANSAKIRI